MELGPLTWTEADGPCPLCRSEPRPCGGVHINLVAGNVIETGAWCDACALPSVVIHSIHVVCEHGWPTATRCQPLAVCMDCRRYGPVAV